MNNAPWTKERIAGTPLVCVRDGHGKPLAYTDEATADTVIDSHNATPDVAYKERMEGAEGELREIDNILDRRDALDRLPNRRAKILKAIELCAKNDTSNDLGKCRDAIVNFLTTWDGADITDKREVFADAVRQLREARDYVGK